MEAVRRADTRVYVAAKGDESSKPRRDKPWTYDILLRSSRRRISVVTVPSAATLGGVALNGSEFACGASTEESSRAVTAPDPALGV